MCGVCSAWRRVALPALFPRLGAPGSTWPQTGFTPGSTAAAHPFLSASGALRMALAGGTISGRPGPAAAAATASPSAAAAAGGGAAGGPGRVPGAVVVHPEQMLCRVSAFRLRLHEGGRVRALLLGLHEGGRVGATQQRLCRACFLFPIHHQRCQILTHHSANNHCKPLPDRRHCPCAMQSGGWAPAPERGANGRGSNGIGSNGAAQV